MNYRQRLREIEARLGNRRLVYFGTRGSDARALTSVRNFDAAFTQVAPLGAPGIEEVCLETLKGERVDLNRYSIDDDPSPAVGELRRGLLKAFGRPAAVIPYRSTAVLASAWFPRADRVLYLGLFHEHQASFDHKAWVETQLAAAGVRVVPWRYYADDELSLVREIADRGPIVVRSNRSDGGAGLALVRDSEDVAGVMPPHRDGFFAVAPLMSDVVPLNVNACVFPGSVVSLHPPSLQLIGLQAGTTRPFGYCGNDFARASALDGGVLDAFEQTATKVGQWMAARGYVGVFGVDALVHGGTVHVTEVNPRFQGSSSLSAQISRDMDRPDLFLDHLAAFIGLPAPPHMPLREMARRQPTCAHVVCHNLSPYPCRLRRQAVNIRPFRCELLPATEVAVAPEAMLFDARFDRAVTTDGSALLPETEAEIRRALRSLYPDNVGV